MRPCDLPHVKALGVYKENLSPAAHMLALSMLDDIAKVAREMDCLTIAGKPPGLPNVVVLGALAHVVIVAIIAQAKDMEQAKAWTATINAKIGLGVARSLDPNVEVPAEVIEAAKWEW